MQIEAQPARSVFEPANQTQPTVSEPRIPAPNDPPWNGWTAFGVWALSVFFTFVIPQIFLVVYLVSKRVPLSDEEQIKTFVFTDEGAIISLLAPVLLVHLLTIAVSWIVVTRFNTFSFRKTLGWERGGFKVWHAILIFVGFLLLANLLVPLLGKVETDFDRMLAGSRTAVYLVAFFAIFTAPLTEEVVYRGLLYSAFQRRFGIVIAGILATLLFAVVHIPQYSSDSTPDYATVIALFGLSAVLTLIRIRTNNLLPCIILHTVINALQSVLLLLEPYLHWLLEHYLKSAEVPNPVATILGLLK
jgi:uncharacterized protein